MSPVDRHIGGEGAQYRRGALMGFTVAESFMLIAFALLLLLVLWRYDAAERDRAMEDLAPAQRAAIARAALEGTLDGVLALPRDAGARDALRAGAVIADKARLSELEAATRLVAAQDMRRLAEAAAILPEDARRRLTDLVRLEDFRDLLERLEALRGLDDAPGLIEAASRLPPRTRQRLLKAMRSRDGRDALADIDRIAALMSDPSARRLAEAAAGLAPEASDALADLARDDALLDKLAAVSALEAAGDPARAIREAMETARQVADIQAAVGGIEREVADRIRKRTGELVAGIDGEITPTGDVVLPDALLFGPGSARLQPEMKRFLNGFCRPWFEILYRVGPSLASVRIEGHASSEWQGLGPRQAYLENLRLSQERARAVFSFCLQRVGDDAVGVWARDRLAAIGYSSARRIMKDGREDRARSRRVVFNIDANRDILFQRIDAAKADGYLASPKDLSGIAED